VKSFAALCASLSPNGNLDLGGGKQEKNFGGTYHVNIVKVEPLEAVETLVVENQAVSKPALKELRVRAVRDYAGIEDLRPIWTSWQSHPNADIDFYLTVLRSLPEVLRPYVLILHRGDNPEAMLIGGIDQSQLEFKIGYKTLYKAPVRQLTLIYGGRLGNLSLPNCELLLCELMNSLRREKVDVVFLTRVRTESALYQAVTHLPGFFTRDHCQAPVRHRSTALPPTAEEFYRCLSAKVRRHLKSQAKKLLSDFPEGVEVRAFCDVQDLDRMIRDVEEVAKKTYQRGLGVGFVDSPEIRTRLRLEAERGWLRAHILYIAGKPATFFMCDLYGDTYHANYLGYDPIHSKYSPGSYLIMRSIKDFMAETGARKPPKIDWGLGDARYKEELGTCDWEEVSPRIFTSTFKGVCLSALWTSTMLVDCMARRLLGKVGIIQTTKKIWRNHLTESPNPPPNSK
jgi:hypothetical protein